MGILASMLLACSAIVCGAFAAEPPAELELSIAAEKGCDDLGIDGGAPAKPCAEASVVTMAQALFMTASAADTAPVSDSRLGAPLVNEPVISGNVYRCFRDPHYEYPVCQKIGTTDAEPTPQQRAELIAAQQTALFVLPVRPRLNPFDGGSTTELCHSTTHGASGCCRITATLENGDVIVECGQR